MEKSERDARIRALERLALATREFPPVVKPEEQRAMAKFFLIYLEDTACYPADVLEQACRHLGATLKWFPKVSELVECCRSILVRRQEGRDAEQLQKRLMPPPIPTEKWLEFKDLVRDAIRNKGMR